jgi:FKBP-type peptidyl-prolyl cis-trans isomerase (trigger factor)
MTDKKHSHNYKVIKSEETDSGLKKVTVEIPWEEVSAYKDIALEKIGRDIEIKGFRKGKAPLNLIEENVGEMSVIQEMSYFAVEHAIPHVLDSEKLNPLFQPKVEITKLTKNSPIEFRMDVVELPKFELPDYKKIAKATPVLSEEVLEEKEVDEHLELIRKNRARMDKLKNKTEEEVMPELDDDFAKSVGNFESLEKLKEHLRTTLQEEKKIKNKEKRRIQIIKDIIDATSITVPDLLIENELNSMLYQFKSDVGRMGVAFEEYLKAINKEEKDLLSEWRGDALKRVKISLVVPAIAKNEKIVADPEFIKNQIEEVKKEHKDVDEEYARVYFENAFINDKVFSFLESL